MSKAKRKTSAERSDSKRDPARARGSKKVRRKAPGTNIHPTSGGGAPSEAPLSPKRQAFVDAYLETSNASEAARRAGYTGTPQAIAVTGSRLLKDAKVAAAIAERQREPRTKAEMTRRELREFWSRVARGEETETHYVLDRESGTVQAQEGAPSMRDRLKSSELLGKSRGMFVEKHELKLGIDSLTALVDSVAGQLDGKAGA